jgi:hypothetical protein
MCTLLFESRETTATSMAAVLALEWLMYYADCGSIEVQVAQVLQASIPAARSRRPSDAIQVIKGWLRRDF